MARALAVLALVGGLLFIGVTASRTVVAALACCPAGGAPAVVSPGSDFGLGPLVVGDGRQSPAEPVVVGPSADVLTAPDLAVPDLVVVGFAAALAMVLVALRRSGPVVSRGPPRLSQLCVLRI